jgi:Flp pilus assembly protein TadG
MARRQFYRDRRGNLCGVFLGIGVLINIGLCALAADTSHFLATKEELQNATDAGALAGAMDLMQHPQDAEKDARIIAAKNFADATSVDDSVSKANVAVNVTPATTSTAGKVHVHAEVTVRNIFAHLLGRHFDTITSDSVAGTRGKLVRANSGQVFPIAVGLEAGATDDDDLSKQSPLYTKQAGDYFKLYFNSTQKNAAFTSFTDGSKGAGWFKDAMVEAAGHQPHKDRVVPAVGVNDNILFTQGTGPYSELLGDPVYSYLIDRTIVLPVVRGEAPFTDPRAVIGFISLKVTSIQKNNNGEPKLIGGILVVAQPRGVSGKLSITPKKLEDAMNQLSAGPVQLID